MLVLVEREHVAAVAQGDVRPAGETSDQNVLEVGLVEAVAEIPAHRRQRLRPRPVQQHAAVGIQKQHAGTENDVRQDRVGKADGLEHAHAFVVEMHRAREMISPRLALQHQRPYAAQAEQVRECRADRAAADDHDVEMVRVGFILHRLSLPQTGRRINASAPSVHPADARARAGSPAPDRQS